jgi:hypothetical protein
MEFLRGTAHPTRKYHDQDLFLALK